MLGHTSLVLGIAGVVAAMTCLDGFNVQKRQLIASLRNDNSVVGGNIELGH